MVLGSRREFLRATALAGLSALVSTVFDGMANAQTTSPRTFHERDYSFDEVKTILGKRYDKLDETERRRVKTYYDFPERSFPGYSYRHYVGVAYSNPEVLHELLSRQKKDFKVSNIPEKDVDFYLYIFPWIKKEDVEKLDKPENVKNLDRLLLIATWNFHHPIIDIGLKGLKFDLPPIHLQPGRRRRR